MTGLKNGYVYILANKRNGTLYVGVTSNITKRVFEHKEGLIKGFTQKYGVNKLMYYEVYNDMYSAISREKQIKGGNRKNKIKLIENKNPYWKDIYYSIIG